LGRGQRAFENRESNKKKNSELKGLFVPALAVAPNKNGGTASAGTKEGGTASAGTKNGVLWLHKLFQNY